MDDLKAASDHFLKGLHALSRGDLIGAERSLLDALKIVPDRPSVLTNLSIVYTKQKRLVEAEELAAVAAAKDRRDPLVWLQLGAVQLLLQKYAEALVSLDSALERGSTIAEIHNNRARALQEFKRLDEALASYDKAISLKPDYAEAYNNRGITLKALRRVDEALASHDKAISLKPDYAEAHNNRGNALKELELLDEAVASYDKAISLRPDYPEAYGNRGNVLKRIGRLDEAIASYEKSILLKPDDATGWLGLAEVGSETGRFDEAEVNYQKARSIDPTSVASLCGLAEVRKFDGSSPIIQEIQELLSSNDLSDQDRARLHHAYAKICNDLGRYDEAMRNFSLGKELLSSEFDIEQHSEAYAAMMRLFTPEFFAQRTGFGLSDERPVFIVGMPRSGTTLTEQILASHHLVEGLGELNDIPHIVQKWCGGPMNQKQFAKSVLGLACADVNLMADSYLKSYNRSRKADNCTRIVDKLPHNYEWLGLIMLMFPKAHIIHCRRDPLDTCISMYMHNFNNRHGYNQDLSILGRYYREYAKLMDHWSAVLPSPIHDFDYESAVSDFEVSCRSLVSFLGIEWDPNCLNYHQQDRQVSTPSRWQVRQPLNDKSVGRWRRYEKHIAPLRNALGAEHL